MPDLDEKKEFAARLKQALKRSSKRIETASELAIQFNLRHPAEPITPQAAQKWLMGTARPTVDKVKTLATWLDVSEQWLRFGVTDMRRPRHSPQQQQEEKAVKPTPDELELLGRLRRLSAYQRQLVEGVIEQFSLDREIWKDN
ncbi:transcriptional regulator [Burkholderia sp. AU6039]|uniref:transcriptional regulator n=1 Tax=Burkholderia sp. AU6039 TaxID=2015344 RepID=UPI000B7A1D11|nr:transcriptional regulator [Burkholderia sp. AU6039]OXJ21302.1 transcriptional regulator [Burkholderia sp. AU6039]